RKVCAAAARLAAAGVAAGTVVAQSFAAEADQLVAMLAAARLGGTVFTVPPATPPPRRARMLRDVGATVLATDLPEIDAEGLTTVRPQATDAAETGVAPIETDPAAPWIIASGSGSTGQPKYLPITHRQQWARMQIGKDWLPYGGEDILLSLIALDFYAS